MGEGDEVPGEWSGHQITPYSQHFSEIKVMSKPVRNQTETNIAFAPGPCVQQGAWPAL